MVEVALGGVGGQSEGASEGVPECRDVERMEGARPWLGVVSYMQVTLSYLVQVMIPDDVGSCQPCKIVLAGCETVARTQQHLVCSR